MRSFFGFRRLVISLFTLIGAMTAFGAPAYAGDDCYSRTVGDWTVIDDPGCALELYRTVVSGTHGVTVYFYHEGNGLYKVTMYGAIGSSNIAAATVEIPDFAPISPSETGSSVRYASDTGTSIAAALYLGQAATIRVSYSDGASAVFTLPEGGFRTAIESVQ